MAKLAAEQSSKEALSEEITGPLGFVLTNEDPSQVTKVLFKYAEDNDIDFVIKKGFQSTTWDQLATRIQNRNGHIPTLPSFLDVFSTYSSPSLPVSILEVQPTLI